MTDIVDELDLYLPLEHAEEIRLLQLSVSEGNYHATFQHVKLSEAPNYTALSYVWGNSEERETLVIDKWEVPVASNLWQFFVTLWTCPASQTSLGLDMNDRNSHIYLWIDAVCIDQENISERNLQVRLMKQIYQRASKVMIWLGPSGESQESDLLAMSQLRACQRWFEKILEREGSLEDIPKIWEKTSVPEEDLMGVEQLLDSAGWEALGNLLIERRWWQRVWTVQEASRPNASECMCLDAAFPFVLWRISFFIYRWVRTTGNVTVSSEADRGFRLIYERSVIEARVGWEAKEGLGNEVLGLHEVLMLLRMNQATDQRDQVYAALALVQGENVYDIEIDYALPIASVYIQAAKHILKSTNNLDWLESAGGSTMDGLPSWVPDWSTMARRVPDKKPRGEYLYQASGSVIPEPTIFEPREHDHMLHLKGIYIDRIASVSKSADLKEISEEPWVRELLKDLYQEYALTSETIYEALYRTFLMDCVWENDGLPLTRSLGTVADAAAYYKDKDLVTVLTQMSLSPSGADPDVYINMAGAGNSERIMITEKGYVGVVHADTLPGDHVAVLLGSHVLQVLRPASNVSYTEASKNNLFQSSGIQPVGEDFDGTCIHMLMAGGGTETVHHSVEETCNWCTDEPCRQYYFIAEAYVHGLMDGQALTLPGTGGLRHIVLV